LPIHILFSGNDISRKSLLRASISSLAGTPGSRFFPLHVILSYWIVICWTITLLWCAKGLFWYRAKSIQAQIIPSSDHERLSEAANNPNRGLRWRTIIVTNIPSSLRSEKDLQEYFEYYLSRPLQAPITPNLMGKAASMYFRRAKKTAGNILPLHQHSPSSSRELSPPQIERIHVVRKLTDLASLLRRREDNIRKLELAHLKLAKRVLQSVKASVDRHPPSLGDLVSIPKQLRIGRSRNSAEASPQSGEPSVLLSSQELVNRFEPYLHEFDVPCPKPLMHLIYSLGVFLRPSTRFSNKKKEKEKEKLHETIWEALHEVPRQLLDPYQPLIRLKTLFQGSTVPAIDYYNTKVAYLTNLIEEHRAKSHKEHPPASTAFVIFRESADAFRACKYLPSHPDNPVACLTAPAPDVMDLNWNSLMKSTFTGEVCSDRQTEWHLTNYFVTVSS
jgi:Cytosolic domain of 10TM putative phosphate transporter